MDRFQEPLGRRERHNQGLAALVHLPEHGLGYLSCNLDVPLLRVRPSGRSKWSRTLDLRRTYPTAGDSYLVLEIFPELARSARYLYRGNYINIANRDDYKEK
jgi:hypothetical protein